MKVSVMWRGNTYTIEIDPNANLKELGYELRKLTGVTAETLRLIVPRLNEKGSNLILPFSDEHLRLTLHESSIVEVCIIIPHKMFFCLIKFVCFVIIPSSLVLGENYQNDGSD